MCYYLDLNINDNKNMNNINPSFKDYRVQENTWYWRIKYK